MIDDLKPYSECKLSSHEWLGPLPVHWNELRAKYLFYEIDNRSTTGQEELLSVSHLTGVTPRSQKTVTMFLANSNVGHKICHPGDVVINTMWAWMGALGVARQVGIVSPSYGVYRPLADSRVLPRYADYLLRTPIYSSEYRRRSTGVNSSRLRLYPEQFLKIAMVVPSLEEQTAIVRFLDWANRQMERAIQVKKKERALASEALLTFAEQALQQHSAKKLRLSTIADVMSRPIERQVRQSYTPIGLYNRGRGIFHKAITEGAELGDSDFFLVEDGDLVISGQFAWEGAIALAKSRDSGCVASHRFPILRGRQEYASSAVLVALFRTSYGSMVLDSHSRGAAGRNRPLNLSTLLKEKIPIPSLTAQVHITELLEREYAIADSLLQTVQLINEYRTRLVSDVVTGKLDVREAAGNLPDEGEEEIVEDDIEDITDTDWTDENEVIDPMREEDDN